MGKKIKFIDIENARKILELGKSASIHEVKESYRKLSLKYHPDKYNNDTNKRKYEEKTKVINNSYKILMDYCANYPISFKKEKVI